MRIQIMIHALVLALFPVVGTRADDLNFFGELAEGDEKLEETLEYSDTYDVRLEAGQFVDAYLTSEDFDTYIIIVPPEGEQISVDDYYEDDTNAGVLFVARETGTYQFIVTSHAPGETGAYQLECSISESTSDVVYEGELAEDDEVSWKGGEYVDKYELELQANETRILTFDSEDFDTYLAIHTPEGEVYYVYGFPSATTIDSEEEAGTYTLVVTSMEAREVGAYRLEVLSFAEEEE